MNNHCLAQARCKSAGASICNVNCPLFSDLRYQLELAGIPKKYQHYIVSSLPEEFTHRAMFKEIAVNIADRVDKGFGLYLHSQLTGTGKTTLVAALAIEYMVERIKVDLRERNRTPQLVRFIHVPQFLDDLRKAMNDDDAARDAIELNEILAKVPVVIMDDIGAEKISEWSRERLLTVINSRYDNERSTFYTSNIGLQELEVLLGARIRSRIEGMTVPIAVKASKDWRRKI